MTDFKQWSRTLLTAALFAFVALPALAQGPKAEACRNQSVPAHKIANQRACQSPGAISLTPMIHRQIASWGQPGHKLAAQAHHPVSHVEPGLLPQTPAAQNWSIPAHQIANRQLKPEPSVKYSSTMQGRRLASR